jgi:hypothetical protein
MSIGGIRCCTMRYTGRQRHEYPVASRTAALLLARWLLATTTVLPWISKVGLVAGCAGNLSGIYRGWLLSNGKCRPPCSLW